MLVSIQNFWLIFTSVLKGRRKVTMVSKKRPVNAKNISERKCYTKSVHRASLKHLSPTIISIQQAETLLYRPYPPETTPVLRQFSRRNGRKSISSSRKEETRATALQAMSRCWWCHPRLSPYLELIRGGTTRKCWGPTRGCSKESVPRQSISTVKIVTRLWLVIRHLEQQRLAGPRTLLWEQKA